MTTSTSTSQKRNTYAQQYITILSVWLSILFRLEGTFPPRGSADPNFQESQPTPTGDYLLPVLQFTLVSWDLPRTFRDATRSRLLSGLHMLSPRMTIILHVLRHATFSSPEFIESCPPQIVYCRYQTCPGGHLYFQNSRMLNVYVWSSRRCKPAITTVCEKYIFCDDIDPCPLTGKWQPSGE